MITPKRMDVNTTSRHYPIYFTTDFDYLAEAIHGLDKTYSRFVIISDDNVKPLYAKSVIDALQSFGCEICVITFIPGEHSKNLGTISSFYKTMITNNCDRKTLVIALGGGVTGDMAGYTAATYMRGVDFIQIPTTLLAQVDSSIGGKTGVDFEGYKNIVGAFYQPMFVYINVKTLDTLPQREFISGMAEVIKHGFIKDTAYCEFLLEKKAKIMALDTEALIHMIYTSCAIKKAIVDMDECEQGVRGLLNFGHTFGHGIERLKDFEYLHGECVAIGMHGGLVLSNALGYLSNIRVNQGLELLQAYNLPITTTELSAESLYQEMYYDKKTTHQRIVFALLADFGDSFLSQKTIPQSTLYHVMDKILS